MRSIIKRLSAPWILGSLFIILAAAMAMATFVENSYGTDAAKALVYNSTWFELIFFLLSINLIANLLHYKTWRWSKISLLLFHLSFLIIIIGAAVTRYTGEEGLLAIRENQEECQMLSLDPEVLAIWNANNEEALVSKTAFLSVVTPFEFNETLKAGNTKVSVKSIGFIPNAIMTTLAVENGEPLAVLTLSGRTDRQEIVLHLGETTTFNNWNIAFEPADTANVDILLTRHQNSLQLYSALPYAEINRDDLHTEPTLHNHAHLVQIDKVYDFGFLRLTLNRYLASGQKIPVTTTHGKDNGTPHALIFDLQAGDVKKQAVVFGRSGQLGTFTTVEFPEGTLQLKYGARKIPLSFCVHLNKFVLSRYPGSESPSSYLSEITLTDSKNNVQQQHTISMNNILYYNGYRLYQSSYDRDELGTVLSVNRDAPGTIITYLGYFLMTLGMMLALIQPKTRFRRLMKNVNKIHQQKKSALLLLALLLVGLTTAQSQTTMPTPPNEQAAKMFGALWVQDNGGRTKPLNTLHQEVVVKLVKHNSFMNHSVDQMILGILMYPQEWQSVPLITVKHSTLREILQLSHKKATFQQFFNHQRQYIIHQMVDEAHRTNPAHRSKLDQEVIKIDEQVNIFYMLLSGKFHRIYPQPSDSHLPWLSPTNDQANTLAPADSAFVKNSLPFFIQQLRDGNHTEALSTLAQISDYQQQHGNEILPSHTHGKMERLYNRLNIFLWLSTLFFGLGLLLVAYQFALLLKPTLPFTWTAKVGNILVLAGFAYYTFGLALRWYVAGHAPWSNGYESMVFIGWAILLSAIFWVRKSTWVLPISSTFAGLVLMVAHLSWMNPQITSLVPVLQSYWLTLHVSVITAGYGFLTLGALLGFFNLITMSLRNQNNYARLQLTINELTAINEMALTVGLYLMTIGSFLGGIWANESWGRYWGWDAKETWSLVTIVLYALVLHLRFIPGLKGKLAFNIASLITLSSVIMTYLGVNYYLSGMHSYGAGEAMPIPNFVYYSIAIIIILSITASINQNTRIKKDQI